MNGCVHTVFSAFSHRQKGLMEGYNYHGLHLHQSPQSEYCLLYYRHYISVSPAMVKMCHTKKAHRIAY